MTYQKRNVRDLPRDQNITPLDQILGLDAETNLVKLFNALDFKGDDGLSIATINSMLGDKADIA